MTPDTLDRLLTELRAQKKHPTDTDLRRFAKHLLAEESQYMGSKVRIYAAIRDFRVACPKCGEVYVMATDEREKGEPAHFNRNSSRFDCPSCKAVFLVGLVLWPARTPLRRHSRPADTVPSWREAAALADISRGIAATRERGFNERVNVLEEEVEVEE